MRDTGIFLAAFLIPYFLIGRKRSQHDLWAISLLCVFASFLSAPYLLQTGIYALQVIPPSLPFFAGPLFLGYIQSLINREWRAFPSFGWHLLFPLSAYIIVLTIFPEVPGLKKVPIIHEESDKLPLYVRSLGAVTLLHMSAYAFISIWKIMRHRKEAMNFFSMLTSNDMLKWPARMIGTYIFLIIILFILEVYGEWIQGIIVYRQDIHMLIIFSFIIFLGYINLGAHPVRHPQAGNHLYNKSLLSDTKIENYASRVARYFMEEKPYKKYDFSIIDLEQATEISRHHLSQIFSREIGHNFYNYVNKMRVEEVIFLMKQDSFKDYSLLRLAHEAGFNSKATFNRAFKQFTGETPSTYRVSHVQADGKNQ